MKVSSSKAGRAILLGLAVGVTVAIAACAGTSSVPTYDLIAPREFGKIRPARGLLAVAVPNALQVLDTEKIVVEPALGVVTYASDAQWSDRLPRLLQARIVEAFENSTRIRAVARASDRVSADAQLVTDIRTFGIQGNNAVIEISAKIISERGGRIVAANVFTARVPAPSASGANAANAINDALSVVLVDMVRWTASKI